MELRLNMQIILNGEIRTIGDKTTLHDLVAQLNYDKGNFAIAVNASVIPRGQYLDTWLQSNDKVEIVTAFYGG